MNPMVIRIAANLTAFKANMAEMKVQLETNASAMKRMSSSFDGSKIIGDANAMVKSIRDMGRQADGTYSLIAGAAKLNEAEQRRVNASVTEAIQKYKLLGREAPPELLALRDATTAVAKPTESLSGTLTKFAAGARTVGIGLTAAVTAPIIGMGAAIVKLGMDAVESENLVSVSFGNMKGAADQWAAGLSKNLGLNRFETEKMAGTLFNMTTSMGLTRDAAFEMSTGVVQLAADMSSFRNIPMEEALNKIRAGLTGEAEPLKHIGILVTEATVKTYAYVNGIAKQGAELTEQQKVLARYGLILKQTSNDQGDLARTMDSPANQLRIMKSRVQEAATSLGVSLLPVIQSVIGSVAEMVPYIQRGVEWFTKLPSGVQVSAVALAGLAAVIGPMLLVMSSLASAAVTMIPLFGVGLPAAAGTSTVSLGLLTAGVKGLTVAMIANPWTAALLALGGLAIAYRAAAKEVAEHTDAERSLAREMTYGQGTYGLQAQAIDKVTAARKRLNDELNRNAAGPGSHMNQYQTTEQAATWFNKATVQATNFATQLTKVRAEVAALSPEVIRNFKAADQLGESNETLATIIGKTESHVRLLKEQLSASQKQITASASESKKFTEDVKTLGDRYANLVKEGVPAAEIVQRLGKDALAAGDRAQELGKGIATIPPHLQKLGQQYVITTALQKADQEAMKLTPGIVAANVKATMDLVVARSKATEQAMAEAKRLSEAEMKASMTTQQYMVAQAKKALDDTRRILEPLKAIWPELWALAMDAADKEFLRGVDAAGKAGADAAKKFWEEWDKWFEEGRQAAIEKTLEKFKGLFDGMHIFADVSNQIANEFEGKWSQVLRDWGKSVGDTASAAAAFIKGDFVSAISYAVSSLISFGKAVVTAFGWDNPGRDSIKAFFKEFKGGADELRARLLALGEEGDRLWIRLTQDARGTKGAAAAIKAVEDAFAAAEAAAKAAAEAAAKALRDIRDEIARVSSEGGVISAALKEWLSSNASDPEAQAFILGQVKVAGTAIGRMLEAMERAAKAVGKEFTLTAGGAKAMSLILLAAWDGTAEGLRKMAPDIERLRAALERSGVDGGKAFAQLTDLARLAAGEVSGPLLEAINAGTDALTAMWNSGFLTQEVFQGMVDEIMAQRDALLRTGATADTVNAAMRNDLQRIWELVQDGKFAVDEKTAALLREAEAQGVVGDRFRSSTDRMVIALERLVRIFTQGGDAMEDVADSLGNKMVRVFGTTMVNAARDGARQVQDILNGIKMSEVVVAVRTVIAGSAPSVSGATAPTSSWDRFSRSAPLPTLRTSSAAPTVITVISTLDGKVVAQNQVKYIPRELDFIGARR